MPVARRILLRRGRQEVDGDPHQLPIRTAATKRTYYSVEIRRLAFIHLLRGEWDHTPL